MVKKAGNWTNRLYELAKRTQYAQAEGVAASGDREVKVLVEGPYGA